MADDHLLFRRQFLLAPAPCGGLAHWPHCWLGEYILYAHWDVQLTLTENAGNSAALVGYILDPDHPERSNRGVLDDLLAAATTPVDIAKYLHSMGGRFVLIVAAAGDIFIFHDACGLRSVFFGRHNGKFCVGSQPSILARTIPLRDSDAMRQYRGSRYIRQQLEHWIPSGCSLYENVGHLPPNHFLQLSTGKSERYWPDRPIAPRDLDNVAAEASALLRKLVLAGRTRFELALPLTAGRDSRMLLAACKDIAGDVFFYTLQYRDLQPRSKDIAVPAALLRSLGYTHHVTDCRKPINPHFAEVYENSNSLAHINDWGEIAHGMMDEYPAGAVCMKGNCAEICRCAYYKTGKHRPITSADELVDKVIGWSELPFVRERIADWYAEARPAAVGANMDLLDLFYWEHRMGSWQAQSQREWDLVQEALAPFNHRGLLEMMLGVAVRFRCGPNYELYRRMFRLLWPEVLNVRLNPPAGLRSRGKRILIRLGLKDVAARGYRAMFRPKAPRAKRSVGPF